MSAEPISRFIITPHAHFEMIRRGISEEAIREVLTSPEQRSEISPERHVLQSRISVEGKTYLLRVFVDVKSEAAEVVTAYMTSKIEKYLKETL